MKKPLFLLFLILTLAGWVPAQRNSSRPVFRGEYFEIRYPSGFRVKPAHCRGSACDAAFFASPDGSVEFFVYSPLWNGEPSEIELREDSEAMVALETRNQNGKKIRQATIRALDGSYLRSFIDTENTVTNTRTVFGIKYRDQQAYARYRQEYLSFKASLKQYAD